MTEVSLVICVTLKSSYDEKSSVISLQGEYSTCLFPQLMVTYLNQTVQTQMFDFWLNSALPRILLVLINSILSNL